MQKRTLFKNDVSRWWKYQNVIGNIAYNYELIIDRLSIVDKSFDNTIIQESKDFSYLGEEWNGLFYNAKSINEYFIKYAELDNRIQELKNILVAKPELLNNNEVKQRYD